MKKPVKICLIAGITCILMGGGISAVAATMGGTLRDTVRYGGWEWSNEYRQEFGDEFWETIDDKWDEEASSYDYHKENNTNEEAYSIKDVKDLEVCVRNGRLIVTESKETDKITVISNQNDTNWECYVDGDKLKLEVNSDTSWTEDSTGLIMTVYVPENYNFRNAEFIAKSRRNNRDSREIPFIEVKKITADKLDLETKAGSIRVTDGTIGKLDASLDVGAVEFTGSVSGNIDGECNVGALKLQLNDREDSYNYEIQCRLGAVKVGNKEYAGLSSKKDVSNNADKNMDLECSTGAIEVSFVNGV